MRQAALPHFADHLSYLGGALRRNSLKHAREHTLSGAEIHLGDSHQIALPLDQNP